MNCDFKHCDPWMMPAENFSAQNQIRGLNPDSTTHSSGEPVIECDPSLPEITSEEEEVQVHIVSSSESEVAYSSVEEDTEEEEDMYLTVSEDEDNPSDPRLELIDKQFNLKMKELFSRSSSGQLMPYTVEASLQNTADEMIKHLAKSHPLTWIVHQKSSPEEDELPLWISIMQDNIDVLVTQFQLQMYTRFNKMINEMVKLYHKQNKTNGH